MCAPTQLATHRIRASGGLSAKFCLHLCSAWYEYANLQNGTFSRELVSLRHEYQTNCHVAGNGSVMSVSFIQMISVPLTSK